MVDDGHPIPNSPRPVVTRASAAILTYGLVNGIASLAALLSIPLLVRLIGIEEFGQWSLIEPVVYFGTAIALFGADHGLIKQVAHDKISLPIASGALVPPLGVSIAVAGVLATVVASFLVRPAAAAFLGCVVGAEAMLAFLLAGARAERNISCFSLGQIGRTLPLFIVLAASLWVGTLWVSNLSDYLAIRALILAAVLLALVILVRPRLQWSLARYADAVRYGAFILFTSLLLLALDTLDRYVLAVFSDHTGLGVYAVHLKIALLLTQGITAPFMLWFPAERFRHLADPDGGERFFRSVAFVLFGFLGIIAGSIFFVAPLIVSWMAPQIQISEATLAFVLVTAVAIGMSYPLNIGLLKPGQTHANVYAALSGLAVAAASSIPLTAAFGASGAAGARALGAAAYLSATIALSQKAHHIRFPFSAMIVVGAGFVGIAFLVRIVNGTISEIGSIGQAVLFAALSLWLSGYACKRWVSR